MSFARFWIFVWVLAAAAFDAAAATADPGGIAISPIRVDLRPGERGSAVTLTNTAAQRKTIQVETFAWSQPGFDDVYEATRALVVNPPLFFIEPGASQVVRVGRSAVAGAGSGAETAYRIYFREVPPEATGTGQALRVALRIGIPVFTAPATGAAPQLAWSGIIHRDGGVELIAENSGLLHARVADVRLLAAQGADVLGHGEGFRYVLPHARQHWLLPASAAIKPGAARVAVLMEEGAKEFPLVLQAE